MPKSKKEKVIYDKLPISVNEESAIEQENAENRDLPYSVDDLMPELEELVKKNPNRLIGCGG